jgi:hypothetical protein
MRVLVVGTLPRSIDTAEQRLRDAGHEVVRCTEAGQSAFPCAALTDARGCPLEVAPVDVVFDARERTEAPHSPFEAGASCALKRRIPLVTSGAANPFAPWAVAALGPDEDIVAGCEAAAGSPSAAHGAVATDAACAALEMAGVVVTAADTRATVRRRNGGLHVLLELADSDPALDDMIAVRVVSAVRAFDSGATGIDVSITHRP